MRILQICSARLIGGGERYLADLSNALAERGHDIFVALAPDAPLKDELGAVPRDHILFARMRNALDVSSAFEIASFAGRNEIEIIHAHLARDYPLAALAARLARKPFALTRHVLFPLKRVQKFVLQQVGGIIAPSHAIAESLARQNLFAPDKIEVIRYGIDLRRFTRIEKSPDGDFAVGTVGHLAPIKGHDVFVRAAEIVARQRSNIRFIIVGEDKSPAGNNRRELEEQIAASKSGRRLEMVGWSDDIRPALKKFDVFVSAARAEAFGLVMVEAMASGLPVVATRSEGAAEIIEDGISGVLVPNEDAESLAKAILELADDQERRENLIENGRQRVREYFSLEIMTAKTEEFYRRLLKNSSAKP